MKDYYYDHSMGVGYLQRGAEQFRNDQGIPG